MSKIPSNAPKVFTKINHVFVIFYTIVAVFLSYSCLFLSNSVAEAADEKIFEIRISNGQIVTGNSTVRVEEGNPIKVFWTSNEPVELHLHGYDILLKLKSNETNFMKFIAQTAGRFPISIHGLGGHDHSIIVYLEVYPQ
jgi:hypothetical protein